MIPIQNARLDLRWVGDGPDERSSRLDIAESAQDEGIGAKVRRNVAVMKKLLGDLEGAAGKGGPSLFNCLRPRVRPTRIVSRESFDVGDRECGRQGEGREKHAAQVASTRRVANQDFANSMIPGRIERKMTMRITRWM